MALLDGGINLSQVFNNIFSFRLEFNEWPGAHSIEEDIIMPYNDSPCDLRYKYGEVFAELEERVRKAEAAAGAETKQANNKVKYTLNLLPSVLRDDATGKTFFEALQDYGAQDLEIFDSEVVQQLIQFKWIAYGAMVHNTAAFAFLGHLLCMTIFVHDTYVHGPYG